MAPYLLAPTVLLADVPILLLLQQIFNSRSVMQYRLTWIAVRISAGPCSSPRLGRASIVVEPLLKWLVSSTLSCQSQKAGLPFVRSHPQICDAMHNLRKNIITGRKIAPLQAVMPNSRDFVRVSGTERPYYSFANNLEGLQCPVSQINI